MISGTWRQGRRYVPRGRANIRLPAGYAGVGTYPRAVAPNVMYTRQNTCDAEKARNYRAHFLQIRYVLTGHNKPKLNGVHRDQSLTVIVKKVILALFPINIAVKA